MPEFSAPPGLNYTGGDTVTAAFPLLDGPGAEIFVAVGRPGEPYSAVVRGSSNCLCSNTCPQGSGCAPAAPSAGTRARRARASWRAACTSRRCARRATCAGNPSRRGHAECLCTRTYIYAIRRGAIASPSRGRFVDQHDSVRQCPDCNINNAYRGYSRVPVSCSRVEITKHETRKRNS